MFPSETARLIHGGAPECDGRIELRCVKRPGLRSERVAVEAPEPPRAIEKAQRRQSAPRFADHKRPNQRAAGADVLLHKAFQCDRELMDRVGWCELECFGQLLVGDRLPLSCHLFEIRPYPGFERRLFAVHGIAQS